MKKRDIEQNEHIKYAKALVALYNKDIPMNYTENENECIKNLLKIIEKQEREIRKLKVLNAESGDKIPEYFKWR